MTSLFQRHVSHSTVHTLVEDKKTSLLLKLYHHRMHGATICSCAQVSSSCASNVAHTSYVLSGMQAGSFECHGRLIRAGLIDQLPPSAPMLLANLMKTCKASRHLSSYMFSASTTHFHSALKQPLPCPFADTQLFVVVTFTARNALQHIFSTRMQN